jgi:hypothetical protein
MARPRMAGEGPACCVPPPDPGAAQPPNARRGSCPRNRDHTEHDEISLKNRAVVQNDLPAVYEAERPAEMEGHAVRPFWPIRRPQRLHGNPPRCANRKYGRRPCRQFFKSAMVVGTRRAHGKVVIATPYQDCLLPIDTSADYCALGQLRQGKAGF